MRVAVLGAAGTIAPAIVRDLADSEEVEAVELLDLRGEIAAQVAREWGGGKATSREADARSGLAELLGGADLLINSASYRVNLDAMRACLEAGCHYLDLGGLYRVTGDQLALDAEFADSELLAMLGVGSSPGKTNLMAARAVHDLGQKPEAIHVSAAGRDLDPPAGFSTPYALQTLIDELTMPPIVLDGGEPEEVEPLSDGGDIDYGDPVGVASTIRTIHSELRTFGESFGCGECTFRLSLTPALLERLRELTTATPEEIASAAADVVRPSSKTLSIHIIDATANGSAARARCLTPPHEEWGLGGGIVSTASPAAAAARMLARGEVTARGALPPERCLDPDTMFAELETRGCVFDFETTKEG